MEHKRRRIGSLPGEQTLPQLQQQGGQQDYYALLELSPGADFDAIKHAYHKLALKYHPDRNKGNEVECETKFKELAAAYAVLSDPEKRSQYDASHQARFWGQSNDLREVFNQFVSSGSTGSFSDFFGSFSSRSFTSRSSASAAVFGQQGSFSFNKKRPPSKGQNLRTTLQVTFNESVVGCTKTIALKTLGVVVDETTKCKCCHHGRVHQTKELRIEVPAGVMKNMRKIYEGEGDVGEYGGVAGDLIVVFDVEDSPVFTREGDDATCDASVTFFQAALGARLAVPGLYGQLLRLDIPAGTQPHDVLRLDDEGFVNVATRKRGHLYVRVVLDIPKALTPLQADLLARAQHQWDAVTTTTATTTTTDAPYDEPTTTMPSEASTDYYGDDVTSSSGLGSGDGEVHGGGGFDSTPHLAEGDDVGVGGGPMVEENNAGFGYSDDATATTGTTTTTMPLHTPMPMPTTTPDAPTIIANGLHHHHHIHHHIANLNNISIDINAAANGVGGYECS
ncbi:Chaperone protein dnaJ, putative [Acanthamoeba castellanii str. Neff]|uniref:Chaperone protein dnaJ, putative n=1 Tax=Acanthamoeba castellanii (strain ATCC 30010 / Neff) TaxID=1257118 RepID=L8GVJ2_ACACF|nr:Chaperone protein dnaJ, putative [Acanthamoeba castellanii str. Neff]ELR17259.1 Chaperone protein dnaJ, putative [Acanthamoeba castellanii str. Neff]